MSSAPSSFLNNSLSLTPPATLCILYTIFSRGASGSVSMKSRTSSIKVTSNCVPCTISFYSLCKDIQCFLNEQQIRRNNEALRHTVTVRRVSEACPSILPSAGFVHVIGFSLLHLTSTRSLSGHVHQAGNAFSRKPMQLKVRHATEGFVECHQSRRGTPPKSSWQYHADRSSCLRTERLLHADRGEAADAVKGTLPATDRVPFTFTDDI